MPKHALFVFPIVLVIIDAVPDLRFYAVRVEMRAIFSEMMYPSLYDCLFLSHMSSWVHSEMKVIILKEHLVACGTPRRAMMANVLQRRLERFVQKRWNAGGGRIQPKYRS